MGTKREQRIHLDRHGKTKETYESFEAAQEQADYLNRWKPRQWHYPSEAYACSICEAYHVGGRRYGDRISRKEVQIIEVGEHAYRELVFENRRSQRSRYRRIVSRYYKGHPGLLKRLYTSEMV